jgi:hypothetical protein
MGKKSKVLFIIPFASKSTVSNWDASLRLLKRTVRSILQLPEEFASILVVGHDCPLGITFDHRCKWLPVSGKPPKADDYQGKLSDKSLKVSSGVKHAFIEGYKWTMFVDADDLVSKYLYKYCDLENYDAVCFNSGYSWNEKNRVLNKIGRFHQICGTSWIMKVSPDFFPMWLGNSSSQVCDIPHNQRLESLEEIDAKIQFIKKPMAIYSVGHESSMNHYKSYRNVIYFNLGIIKSVLKYIVRYRPLTISVKNEFAL